MDHSAVCIESAAKMRQAIKEWETAWPNHCGTCEGYGVIQWYEHHGLYLNEPMTELCDDCTNSEDQSCPRCGTSWLNYFTGKTITEIVNQVDDLIGSEKPCPVCGWRWGNGDQDYRPSGPECICEAENYDYSGDEMEIEEGPDWTGEGAY